MPTPTNEFLAEIQAAPDVARAVEPVLRAVLYAGCGDAGSVTKILMGLDVESVTELTNAGRVLHAQGDVVLNGEAETGLGGSVRLRDLLPANDWGSGVTPANVLRAGPEDGGLEPGWRTKDAAPEDVENTRQYRIGSTAETIFNMLANHTTYSEQDRATLARQIATQLDYEGRLR